jgi:hypothetical protein
VHNKNGDGFLSKKQKEMGEMQQELNLIGENLLS